MLSWGSDRRALLARRVVVLLALSLHPFIAVGQRVEGVVVDAHGRGVGNAEVYLREGNRMVALTNERGEFSFQAEGRDSVCLDVRALGFFEESRCVLPGSAAVPVRVTLRDRLIAIEGVGVRGQTSPHVTVQRLDIANLLSLQAAGSGVESLVKLMPGVHSNNELSTQYSVRGGAYDENLVYVDGIEVLRPQLARSGSQEGMPIINPDMVSVIEFSSGGFPANFGDRLSSVLNVRYRTPRKFGAKVDLSLMENRACIEGASSDKRLSGILGVRYKSTRLLLNTTETKGDYHPSYFDVQAKGRMEFNPDCELSALLGFSRNVYFFKPHNKVTRFGALTADFLQMNVYYEGQERDIYMTMFGTVQTRWRATPRLTLRGQLGGYWVREEEKFDILGEYWLSELRGVEEVRPVVDSASNVGIGGFLEHARNRFEGAVATVKGNMDYQFSLGNVEVGLELSPRYFYHVANEWNLMDSAGYAVPRALREVPVQGLARGAGGFPSMLYSMYAQTQLRFPSAAGILTLVVGMRGSGVGQWRDLRVSPRVSASFVPESAKDLRLYVGGGLYYQYPFYREIRDRAGGIHPDVHPQRSIHALGGAQWGFQAGGRPFRLQAEVYAKWGAQLVPYVIDNVRLRYEAQNAAKSQTYGMDLRLNGELAPGVESWVSLSVMRSRMRITDKLREANRQPAEDTYFYAPHDQLFGASLLLQDYLPGVPGFRVALQASYALGIPLVLPNGRYGQQSRMPSYKRVDIGFSYAFKDENYSLPRLSRAQWLKSLMVSAEVLNLLNFANTVSYMWIKVTNAQGRSSSLAVPNYLTSRCVNIRFVMSI